MPLAVPELAWQPDSCNVPYTPAVPFKHVTLPVSAVACSPAANLLFSSPTPPTS